MPLTQLFLQRLFYSKGKTPLSSTSSRSIKIMATDTLVNSKKVREKVLLKPGFHLSDWNRLVRAANDLSGQNNGPMLSVTKEELAQHKSPFDAWTAYKGKVYNITQYMAYHPGEEKILMELAAGQDCTEEFAKYHKWVNMDAMLGKCIVGKLVESKAVVSVSKEPGGIAVETVFALPVVAEESDASTIAPNQEEIQQQSSIDNQAK